MKRIWQFSWGYLAGFAGTYIILNVIIDLL